ncbi:ATP-dependent RNA helicase HrpA [Magnetofaba australis]|uniref:Putative ATP-dependent helicase HrpA n=1 Tax=Magnetofaba australis IT-1 TaxID=1434232 RepID=A0A1Y2K8Z0_9PROT|nr:ATP-dependent RNA helicase HrpA [Magnetofaba australis]OSM05255.1 putative ATP-dependent helicase HrpA [Magnetofaba australis IT-1]
MSQAAKHPKQRLNTLWTQLDNALRRDQTRLRRRIQGAQKAVKQNRGPKEETLLELEQAVSDAVTRRDERVRAIPEPNFPEQLPVSARRDEIAAAIREHQVVVLCGETGSGKTTQLPKICLQLGRGVNGFIGVTQPRRIAARAIAEYLAEDLGSAVGETVGYKVRFHDRVNAHSLVKVMTDGMLLAETQQDRWLEDYDTLIVDEAHERSLNIDFLLGYIKRILPRRPDLKLIISSATLDTEKFSKHFDNAPIIEVSGRAYPVETRYAPITLRDEDEDEVFPAPGKQQQADLRIAAILDAVDELFRDTDNGDVLVFLPGEREIRETAEALRKHHPPHTEVLGLYARLSAAEQHRIFHPGDKRRVILATNIAETSLTVPRIRGVVDTGLARISRYSGRTQVQRLPIENISQASANQRKGRCGRIADGICIRLYSEEEFLNRPEHTDPEALRTSLAAVILSMKSLNLGDPLDFPFIDPPRPNAVRDGLRLLDELGAIEADGALTEVGRHLAKLPVDPRIGRILLAANERGVLTEALIIAAALSTQDPRERPDDQKQKADDAHRRFADNRSEFLAQINLWRFIEKGQRQAGSANKFRKFLKQNFLSWVRVREWRDIHQQLTITIKELGFRPNMTEAAYEPLHQSILTGLLGNIGFKVEKRQFDGTRQLKFHVFPGSHLYAKPPKWIMSAELAETSKLYARQCAKIEPEWVELVAPHQVQKQTFEPHWSKRAGQVSAYERVSLLGLTLVPKRLVHYGPIDPVASRQIFIQEALVAGEIHSDAPFHLHNRRLIAEAEELEHRARARGILAEDYELFRFFDEALPEWVVSVRDLTRWRRNAEKKNPKALFLPRDLVIHSDESDISGEEFPGHLTILGQEIALEYQFTPGHGTDGVSAHIPLPALAQMPAAPFEWLVPGMLEEKLLALLKTLPKSLRRPMVPLPDAARTLMRDLTFGDGRLIDAVERVVEKRYRVAISRDDWDLSRAPEHLTLNFKVLEPKTGRLLAQGRDLTALQAQLGAEAKTEFDALPKSSHEISGKTSWQFGAIDERVDIGRAGRPLYAYPALTDEGDTVALKLYDAPLAARNAHERGLRRLFLLQLPSIAKTLLKNPPINKAAQVGLGEIERRELLNREFAFAAAQRAFIDPAGGAERIRTEAQFLAAFEAGRAHLMPQADKMARLLESIHSARELLKKRLKAPKHPAERHLAGSIKTHLAALLYPGFLLQTPLDQLAHYPRYLKAAFLRLERGGASLEKDKQKLEQVAVWEAKLEKLKAKREADAPWPEEMQAFRWMIEEYRVSLFAQDLKTAIPVSEKRLEKQYDAIPAQ